MIGGGVGNYTAILNLLDNGYPGELITVIEKGTSITERDLKSVLEGSTGSSSVSDNKVVFSEFMDKPMNEFLGLDRVRKYYDKYKEYIVRFHPEPHLIDVYEPLEQVGGICDTSNDDWNKDLKVMNSTVMHVGSKYGVLSAVRIEQYIRDQGVNLYTKTEVSDIDFENKKIFLEHLGFVSKYSYPSEITYDKLFVAPGKAAKKSFTKWFDKINLKSVKDNYEIGVRFEIPFSERIQQVINETSYDFKFTKFGTTPSGCDYKIRSFCVCHITSEIKTENFKEPVPYKGINGVAHGTSKEFLERNPDLISNTTNFGIIINKKTNDDIILKIIENLNRKTVCYETPECNFTTAYEDYDKVTHITIDEFLKAYEEDGQIILDFIEELKPILGFGDNWRMYGLEFKDSAPTFLPNLHSNMSVKGHEDVYCFGDILGGGVVGITPAILGAFEASNDILEKQI